MANTFRAKSLISRTGTFSHEVTAPNLVYNTGDQSITGLKDFIVRPTVNTIPVLLSGEASANIEQYVKNDEGTTIYKGQPVYVNGANGNNILIKLARNTGEGTSSKTFGLLKQNLLVNEFGYVVSEGVISNIDTSQAGSEGDPIWLGETGNLIFGLANKPYAPNHLVYLGFVERKHANQGKIFVKIQNGFELNELHNVQINHSNPLNNDDILRYDTASGLWFNKPLNTGVFQTQINSLSGAAVLTYGTQTISGTKYFNDAVYTNNLYVTGTEFIANVQNNFVQSPYLILNLTGGAIDGGIFFVTGSGLTGLNDYGPIIGFDHSDQFKFGIGRRGYDISTLNTIASFGDIQTYSGFVDNKYATIINLGTTGSNLQNNINTLTNNLSSTGSTLQSNIDTVSTNLGTTGSTLQSNINTLTTNLGTTGSSLDGKINLLSGSSVLLYGNQNVTGVKTFIDNQIFSGNIGVSGTGIFNGLDLNNIDNLSLSGIDISITGSTVNVYGNILISGNPVLTGIPDGSWASQTELDGLSGAFNNTGTNLSNQIQFLSGALNNTGVNLNNYINSLSGSLNASGTDLSNRIVFVSGALNNTGVNLNNYINSLSGSAVLIYGDQIITGNKTFNNTGTFNTLSITNKKLTSYAYYTGNFSFGDNYINLINSSNRVTGTLPTATSGVNYYVKNLNTGILLITGSNNVKIDGYNTVDLYNNDSMNLLGVNNIGYTGWITISADGGVS